MFGFNGQEKDNEVSGVGNSNTAEFWQYDSRLGRRWNIDPIVKFFESPYVSFFNNPLSIVDPKGLTGSQSKAQQAEVQKGDGPYRFAERNSISVADLVLYNKDIFPEGLKDGTYMLHPGMKLNIRPKETVSAASSALSAEYQSVLAKSTHPFVENGGEYSVRQDDTYVVAIFEEFADFIGPTNSVFIDGHPMVSEMKESGEIDRMRYLFYTKYNGSLSSGASYTNFGSDFGFSGIIRAGSNWTLQMVGTFSGDVFLSEDGKNLIFVISDSKSLTSLAYRASPSHERETFGLAGNTYQKYIWSEPVDPEWFKSQQGLRDKNGRIIVGTKFHFNYGLGGYYADY